jgi:amino acid transporter
MAALLTGVNYVGVKETASLQNTIVLTLVGLIIAFLAVGAASGPDVGTFNPFGWVSVAATVGTVYVTFIGFEVIATSAEEIKNPSRNLPLSMIAAVVTPTLMYAGVTWVSTGSIPLQKLTVSKIPVADVATALVGDLGGLAMVVGAVLATVSSANASILSAARVNFAMGRDRILTN